MGKEKIMDRITYFRNLSNPGDFDRLIRLDTIVDLLKKDEEEFKNYNAFGSLTETITYHDALEDIAYFRGFLANLKLKENAHVGILLKNNYSFVKTFLAITSFGYTAVLIPVQVSKEDLYGILKLCDVDALVYDEAFEEKVAFCKESQPEIQYAKYNHIESIVQAPMATHLTQDSKAAIIFTGGTSAKAKGVLLSHGAILRGVLNGTYGFKNVFYQRYVSLIPLTHVFGLIRNLLTSMFTGSTFYFCEDMREMFKLFAVAKPTILVVVPELARMFYGIMKLKGVGALGGALQTIICGGAPVPPSLPRIYHELGIDLYPGYGMTETANLVSGNGNNLTLPTSVGIPFPGQELKIVDNELWIKGDNIMMEYYNNPVENAKSFEDGFFKTGDLARLDENGFLYIIGRKKNLIILGNGENVSPEELEAELIKIPLIQDSLVYDDVNEFGNEIIVCEVLPNKTVIAAMKLEKPEVAIQEAIQKVNQKLPSYAQMKKIIIRTEDFVRSPSMKIIRPKKR